MEIRGSLVPLQQDHSATNARAMDILQQYVLQKKER